MTTQPVTPRIYVACLASYNNGRLHGTWIDANQSPEDIQTEVSAMLATSPEENAEEWAIHDHEGFCGTEISEWEGFEQVSELAAFVEEHGELGGALLEHCCGDLEDARMLMSDNYAGCWKSLAEYAQELTEETTQIPEHLQYYIDYEAMARDMVLSGDVFTLETGYEEVHVFWAR